MIPNTPFSTHLSGSAKETERRIRNIFQGQRKRPPVCVILAFLVIIALCGSVVAFVPREARPEQAGPETAGRETVRVDDYLNQPEYLTREINGAETSFARYVGDGWSVEAPAGWTAELINLHWSAPGGQASFSVNPCAASARDVKAYWAALGSWAYETDMPAPFDEYYDGGTHESQPDGTARYEYYFIPVSDDRSYELACFGVWGETSETEWALLHAMLQSFTVDESLHSVRAEPYREGYSELAAALAGLADPQNPVCLLPTIDGRMYERDGRNDANWTRYAGALRAFDYTLVRLEDGALMPEELLGRNDICFHMSGIGCNFYVYENSEYASLSWRGTSYWFTAASPDQPGVSPYEAAYAWFQEPDGAEEEYAFPVQVSGGVGLDVDSQRRLLVERIHSGGTHYITYYEYGPDGSLRPVLNQTAVFSSILEDLYYDRVFPDGSLYRPSGPDLTRTDFAVYDIDGDGKEELILRCMDAQVQEDGRCGPVYAFDEETGTVREQLIWNSPQMIFYDNGFILDRGEYLYQYEPSIDQYSLPNLTAPMNEEQIKGAFPIEFPFTALTEENIQLYKQSA